MGYSAKSILTTTMNVVFRAATAFFTLIIFEGSAIDKQERAKTTEFERLADDSVGTRIVTPPMMRRSALYVDNLRAALNGEGNQIATDEGEYPEDPGEMDGTDGQNANSFVRVMVSHETLLQHGAEVFSKKDVQNYSAVLIDAAANDNRKPGIYVGARNWLIKFDLSFKETEALQIPPAITSSHKEHNESSQNFIRKLHIAAVHEKPHLIVCSTNASSPGCSARQVTDMAVEVDFFRAVFPESPTVGLATYMWGSEIVVGSVFDPQRKEGQIIHTQLRHGAPIIHTMSDEHFLLFPEFVDAFSISEEDKYVYIVFREIAIELRMTTNVMYSRVARICKNDFGGIYGMEGFFGSFTKATISCRGFEKIVDISYVERDRYLWAIFTSNRSNGSVVCAFEMSKVESVFRGAFYVKPDENNPDQDWEEWPPPYIFSGDVVVETCYGIRPAKALKEYTLMFRQISEYCPPILFPDSKVERIAVTPTETADATVFVNDEFGQVWQMKMDVCSPVDIQVWDVIPKSENASNKINDLAIFKDSIIVLTNENLMRIPSSNYPGDKIIPPPPDATTVPVPPSSETVTCKTEAPKKDAKDAPKKIACHQSTISPNKLIMLLMIIYLGS